MRTIGIAGAALLLLGLLVASTPATAHHRPGPCDFHRLQDESIRAFAKRRIVCAVERFGPVPGGSKRAICIARRESGLDPKATSEPTGEYRGLFQHDRDMWPGRYTRYTQAVWDLSRRALSGRTNTIVTIRMVSGIGTWRAAGWPPKECRTTA
ncbi:MAG: hypothetical protein ACRDG8_13595 [Actinomycetota bacterium]